VGRRTKNKEVLEELIKFLENNDTDPNIVKIIAYFSSKWLLDCSSTMSLPEVPPHYFEASQLQSQFGWNFFF
jgi:hypothetical protein